MDVGTSVRMLGFQLECWGSSVDPCFTSNMDPKIGVLIVEFQCRSSDLSVGLKIPVWILAFQCGFWDSNVNSVSPVWIFEFQCKS